MSTSISLDKMDSDTSSDYHYFDKSIFNDANLTQDNRNNNKTSGTDFDEISQDKKFSSTHADNYVANFFKNICGIKCGEFIEEYLINKVAKFLKLDRKKMVVEKAKRLLLVTFQLVVVVLMTYFAFSDVKRLITGEFDRKYNSTANESSDDFEGMSAETNMLVKTIVSFVMWVTCTVCLGLTLWIIEWEEFFGFVHCATCVVLVVSLLVVQKTSIFLSGIHLLMSMILFVVIFCMTNIIWKALFCFIYMIAVVGLFIHDYIYGENVAKLVIYLLKLDYSRQLIVGYVGTYVPISILIVFFFVRMFSEVKWLKNIVMIQKQEIINLEEKGSQDSFTRGNAYKIKKEYFKIKFEEVTLLKKIGKGGSETEIYKANWSGKTVAYKSFNVQRIIQKQLDFDLFEKELSVVSKVSHPNILQFFGAVCQIPKVGFVMEYCHNSDIEKYFRKAKRNVEFVALDSKVRIVIGIAAGMTYLHRIGVIHRDLKPQNVLLNENLEPKIIDFGLSKLVEELKAQKHTSFIGTSPYMPPEIRLGKAYNFKVDVFSFGILIWTLLSSDFEPYGHDSECHSKVAHDPHYRPNCEDLMKVPEQLSWIKMMEKCWSHEQTDRPTFAEIHKYFSEKVLLEICDGEQSVQAVPFNHTDAEIAKVKEAIFNREKFKNEAGYYKDPKSSSSSKDSQSSQSSQAISPK